MQDSAVAPPLKIRPVLLVHACYLALWVLSVATFWGPLRQLLSLALADDRYTHLVVIPFISAWMIYGRRRDIFRATRFELKAGIPLVLIAAGAGWYLSLRLLSGSNEYRLTVVILAALLAWAGCFLLCYGVRAFRPARFPLLFLLLMIPIPKAIMERLILALQAGTSAVIYVLFRLTGTPLFRHGFTFELPRVGIVIAEECTSIHSTWALFILGLLAGHFFLRSFRAKACLGLLTIPIAIFTNSVRIVTIWFLAAHVDIDFLYGKLHHSGGVFFSSISVIILLSSIWALRKFEDRGLAAPPGSRA